MKWLLLMYIIISMSCALSMGVTFCTASKCCSYFTSTSAPRT